MGSSSKDESDVIEDVVPWAQVSNETPNHRCEYRATQQRPIEMAGRSSPKSPHEKKKKINVIEQYRDILHIICNMILGFVVVATGVARIIVVFGVQAT